MKERELINIHLLAEQLLNHVIQDTDIGQLDGIEEVYDNDTLSSKHVYQPVAVQTERVKLLFRLLGTYLSEGEGSDATIQSDLWEEIGQNHTELNQLRSEHGREPE